MKLYQTIRRFLSLALACIALLTAALPALAESYTVYTATNNAKVYDETGELFGTLPANTELTLTGVQGEICRVEKDGRTGYMIKSDLSAEPPQKQEETSAQSDANVTAYAKREGVKVYDESGNTIATLSLNSEVTVTAVKGKACRVRVNGMEGYMYKSDLSASKKEQSGKSVTAYVAKAGAKLYNDAGDPIATLSLNSEVTVTAVKGKACRVSTGGMTGYMKKSELSTGKTESSGQETSLKPVHGTAKEMDWWTSDIQKIFAKGVVAQITDVETGLTWREQRRGGTNHADCQPLTAADTAAMKEACGGTWSWNRRAIFVTINGVNYAASMNCMPHGSGAINDNNFNGHHCIHFTNSRTHTGNKLCPQHQAAVKKAAGATLL